MNRKPSRSQSVRHQLTLRAHSSLRHLALRTSPYGKSETHEPGGTAPVDDTHIIVDGGPVEYVVVNGDGVVTTSVVSREARPVITVRAGSYKALRLVDPAGLALICSVVTPAWTPERVRIGPPARIVRPAWLDDLTMAELTTGIAGSRGRADQSLA